MARKQRREGGGDRLEVSTSSGYDLIVYRPPMQVLRAIMQKAEELHPMPELPTEEVTTVAGETQRTPMVDMARIQELDAARTSDTQRAALEQMTELEKEYWQARQRATYEQNEYLLDWALNKRVDVKGCYDDKQRAELVASFADEMAELREYGSIPAELEALDPFQQVLRIFIIQDSGDYAAVSAAVMRSLDTSDINPEDIRKRAKFLRS